MTRRQQAALGSQRESGRLAALGKTFARFRQRHAPRTRIPDVLRGRVLDALDAGILSATVCRTCGVAPAQLRQWRKNLRTERGARAARGDDAQVLTVIDPAVMREEIKLDVGVGSWRLSIRLRPEGGTE